MLPASAGMIPLSSLICFLASCAPRIRGDDPGQSLTMAPTSPCSPHPRG